MSNRTFLNLKFVLCIGTLMSSLAFAANAANDNVLNVYNWDDYEVNHINNNSLDNTLNNLEWVTKEENERIMLLHSENKKFTKEQVIAICQAFEKNMSFIEICVHVLNIEYTGNIHWKLSNIKRRQTYKEISENYNF